MDKKSMQVSQSKSLLNSGATNHMMSNRTQFQYITPVQTLILITKGVMMMAETERNVLLYLTVKRVKNPVILKKELNVLEMGSSSVPNGPGRW